MHIIVVGLNYRSSPVEVRERFAFTDAEMEAGIARLVGTQQVREAVIVSTCNRTEVYAVVDALKPGLDTIHAYLAEHSGLAQGAFLTHLYEYEGEQAVRHLFRVTAGLDSMVLGETQILGQVRSGFLFSQEQGKTGRLFNNLFRRAVTVAKRAHSETKIGENAVSVSYAAVELAKKIFESLDHKTVLVIGAGKMSELTAKHLNANGATKVIVCNRTYERAKELADKFNGKALDMNSLDLALKEADIVVSSTGAEGYVVTKAHVQATMKKRRHRPLFLIDIAVPRDLDPAMGDLDNVFLYDIDDLEGVIRVNMEERAKEAEKVGVIIGEELVAFRQWMNAQEASPLIQGLRQKALGMQADLMQNLNNKVQNLSDKEIHTVNKLTMALVNQLIHKPITEIKDMATEDDAVVYLEAFKRLFGLEEEAASNRPADGKDKPKQQADKPKQPAEQGNPSVVAVQAQMEQTRQEEASAGARPAELFGRYGTH
ncbi:MAG TPA: glutamyl-tRNA reductase [Bacilli bacterium]|nr:glutamyl-tRNA reductase [Bacilli bacterium]